MSRPIHFEIHGTEPEKLVPFYESLFGWGFDPWGPPGEYWLIRTGPAGEPGIDGGLVRRRGEPAASGQPVNAYVCTVGVDDVDASLGKLVALGGVVALPVQVIPGVGRLAYGKDPDGNLVGMMQRDGPAM